MEYSRCHGAMVFLYRRGRILLFVLVSRVYQSLKEENKHRAVPRFSFVIRLVWNRHATKTLRTMTKFFVIRGTQSAGKTTTCWLVYRYLSAMADEGKLQTIIIGNEWKDIPSTMPPMYYDKGEGQGLGYVDFRAIVPVQGKRIGIISAGDFAEDFKLEVDTFLKKGVDYIICCNRSYNKTNSTFNVFETEYAPNYPSEIFWVEWADDASQMMTAKQKTALCIIEHILYDILHPATDTANQPAQSE